MDDEEKLKAISTDEQRQEVLDLSNTTEEWLYEDQSAMTVTDYKKKQKEIRSCKVSFFCNRWEWKSLL